MELYKSITDKIMCVNPFIIYSYSFGLAWLLCIEEEMACPNWCLINVSAIQRFTLLLPCVYTSALFEAIMVLASSRTILHRIQSAKETKGKRSFLHNSKLKLSSYKIHCSQNKNQCVFPPFSATNYTFSSLHGTNCFSSSMHTQTQLGLLPPPTAPTPAHTFSSLC